VAGDTWAKLDTGLAQHPKVVRAAALEPRAPMLYVCGILWAQRHLTDGHVPAAMLYGLLPAPLLMGGPLEPAADALEAAGLWERNGDGWQVHDYLEWQRSRDEVEAMREHLREVRSAAGKRGAAARWGNGKDGKRMANGAASGTANEGPDPDPETDTEAEADPEAEGAAARPTRAQARTRTREGPPAERPRDELWDELAAQMGHEPASKSERGRWNAALGELRREGVTADELRVLCAEYLGRWSVELTPTALAANLGRLRAGASSRPRPARRARDQAAELMQTEVQT
jgi:hypothetical protein